MMQLVIAKIEALMQAARDNYNVDPVVFLVIYLAIVPPAVELRASLRQDRRRSTGSVTSASAR